MGNYNGTEQSLMTMHKLWRNYGRYILLIVVTASVLITGDYLVRKNKATKSREASVLYDNMIQAVNAADKTTASAIGKQLLCDYKRTPYALLSAMLLTKFLVDGGDFEAAIAQLQQVTKKNYYRDPLWYIAKVRLARLLHNTGKSDLALKELEDGAEDYAALYEEVKGDIYVGMHDYVNARQAYEKAIANTFSDNKTWLVAKLAEIAPTDATSTADNMAAIEDTSIGDIEASMAVEDNVAANNVNAE